MYSLSSKTFLNLSGVQRAVVTSPDSEAAKRLRYYYKFLYTGKQLLLYLNDVKSAYSHM